MVLVETEDVCQDGITKIISRKAITRKALLQLLWQVGSSVMEG